MRKVQNSRNSSQIKNCILTKREMGIMAGLCASFAQITNTYSGGLSAVNSQQQSDHVIKFQDKHFL